MEIKVKVIPSASKNRIQLEGELYKVHLTAHAQEGKANRLLLEYLADHFKVSRRNVRIIKGLKSRHKTINIDT